jgi:hypothetical protein
MKLGIPRLNAMLQNQMPAVASPYMVLSALEALINMQKGQQQPIQQGTVKDRVVAATKPPAGIASLMPQQGYALGGLVSDDSKLGRLLQKLDPNSKLGQLARGSYEYGTLSLGDIANKFATQATEPTLTASYSNERDRRSAEAAPSTDMEGLSETAKEQLKVMQYEYERETNPEMKASLLREMNRIRKGTWSKNIDQPTAKSLGNTPSSIRTSSSSSTTTPSVVSQSGGISSIGSLADVKAPTYKAYEEGNIVPKQLSDIPELQLPPAAALEAAIAKYGKPDEARMAELRDAERRAGLGAFARGVGDIRRGRGLGAVLGGAFADMSDAQEKRADERRRYEDMRDQLALQLGLTKDKDQLDRFLKQIDYKKGERTADLEGQERKLGRSDKIVTSQNEQANKIADFELSKRTAEMDFQLSRERNLLQGEANKISAEIRRDGVTANSQARIERLYQTAREIAIRDGEANYPKDSPQALGDPQWQAKKEAHIERVFAREYDRLNKTLGRDLEMPGLSSSESGNRKLKVE